MYINDVKASECDDSGRKVAGDIVRWIACNWAHVTHTIKSLLRKDYIKVMIYVKEKIYNTIGCPNSVGSPSDIISVIFLRPEKMLY